jgi:hypothetical protein
VQVLGAARGSDLHAGDVLEAVEDHYLEGLALFDGDRFVVGQLDQAHGAQLEKEVAWGPGMRR